MALALVSSCRRTAAWESGSVRTGGLLRLIAAAVLQCGDDLVEVAGDLPVHLGDASVAVRLGGGDDPQGLPPLIAVLREELDAPEPQRRWNRCGCGTPAVRS